MKYFALISGASSGIGYELAHIMAMKGHNLVLTARNIKILEKLKAELQTEFNIEVHCIEQDLAENNAAKKIFDSCKELNIQVEILVNNAGFGDIGYFYEESQDTISKILQVNITALTQLTRLFLPNMIYRKKGNIVNIASTAAFQAGPFMAVYYASKSYVLSFSEAIASECNDFGVKVTCVCPGPTESNFQKNANLKDSFLFNTLKVANSKEVAEYCYKSMTKGKKVAVHGLINKILAFSTRFTPRNLLVYISRKLSEKSYF